MLRTLAVLPLAALCACAAAQTPPKVAGGASPAEALALDILKTAVAKQKEIDEVIVRAAPEWPLEKIAAVDRNILRLGAFELLFMQDTPAAVAFDEAIELARRYGTADSSAFVNGVLDRLRREANPEKPIEPVS